MSEVEKQESQKTVVAFITGLLIGGLLVWVFSSTPDEKAQPEEKKTDIVEVTKTEDQKTEIVENKAKSETEVVGDGSIAVVDQKAGNMVALGSVKTPTKNGWVVVRDYMDGVPGNILGAARYSADEGLLPTAVELVRETVAGSSYQVGFYTQGGEMTFNLSEDTAIEGIASTFKAK